MVRPDLKKWGQTLAGYRPTAKDQLATDAITGLERDDTAPFSPPSCRRVKQVAEGTGFSGHNGRAGTARRMEAAGAPTHQNMAQSRRKIARIGAMGAGLGPVEFKLAVCLPPDPAAVAVAVQKLQALLFPPTPV